MDLPPRSSNWVAFESTSLLVIAITAVAGNVFICLATARNPNLRTTTNLWVTALAVADLARSCITAPMTVGALISGRWNYGTVGCVIQGFFTYFLTLVSLITMAFMALNRYCRVVKPSLYLKIFTKRRSIALLSASWCFLALTVSLPVIIGWAEFSFYPGYAACVLKFHTPTMTRTFLMMDAGLILFPCMVTIAGCYFKVLRAVRLHNLQVVCSLQRSSHSKLISGANIEEIRVTKTLFLLVSTFAICWIPAYTIAFLCRGNLVMISFQGTLAVTFLVGLNSACNPFIYGYMNRAFRVEFWKLIPCKRVENQVVPQLEMENTSPLSYVGTRH